MISVSGYVNGKRRMGTRSHRAQQKDRREMRRLQKYVASAYFATVMERSAQKLVLDMQEKFPRTFCPPFGSF